MLYYVLALQLCFYFQLSNADLFKIGCSKAKQAIKDSDYNRLFQLVPDKVKVDCGDNSLLRTALEMNNLEIATGLIELGGPVSADLAESLLSLSIVRRSHRLFNLLKDRPVFEQKDWGFNLLFALNTDTAEEIVYEIMKRTQLQRLNDHSRKLLFDYATKHNSIFIFPEIVNKELISLNDDSICWYIANNHPVMHYLGSNWIQAPIIKRIVRDGYWPNLIAVANGDGRISENLIRLVIDKGNPDEIKRAIQNLSNQAVIDFVLQHDDPNVRQILFRRWGFPVQTQEDEKIARLIIAHNHDELENLLGKIDLKNVSMEIIDRAIAWFSVVSGKLRKVFEALKQQKLQKKTPEVSRDIVEAFAMLGLEPSATEDEIKNAFKKKILKVHPDKIQGGEESNAQTGMLVDARDKALEYAKNESS